MRIPARQALILYKACRSALSVMIPLAPPLLVKSPLQAAECPPADVNRRGAGGGAVLTRFYTSSEDPESCGLLFLFPSCPLPSAALQATVLETGEITDEQPGDRQSSPPPSSPAAWPVGCQPGSPQAQVQPVALERLRGLLVSFPLSFQSTFPQD